MRCLARVPQMHSPRSGLNDPVKHRPLCGFSKRTRTGQHPRSAENANRSLSLGRGPLRAQEFGLRENRFDRFVLKVRRVSVLPQDTLQLHFNLGTGDSRRVQSILTFRRTFVTTA
jgi:hypothetical protein